jgi:hypothetical protein
MKVLKIFIGFAVLVVFGLAAFSYYSLLSFERDANRKRTEAARAARLGKKEEEKDLKSDETETEKNASDTN